MSYEIWIETGPIYKARNITTGAITSNSNAKTLFQAVLDDMSKVATNPAAVGGRLLVRAGTYTFDGVVEISNSINASLHVSIEGEGMESTIIKNVTNTTHMFDPYCNTTFRGLWLDGNAIGTQLIACGEPVYVNVYDCRISRAMEISVWFGGMTSNVGGLKGFNVDHCIFDDPRSINDQMAFTCSEFGNITNCRFDRTGASAFLQGSNITSGGGKNVNIIGNSINRDPAQEYNGNAISLEAFGNNYEHINIADNSIYKGPILISDSAVTTETFKNISITGNMIYGNKIHLTGRPSGDYSNTIRNIVISNNVIDSPWDFGINISQIGGQVSIIGNILINSNRGLNSNAFDANGMIFAYVCNDIVITDNQLYMNDLTPGATPYGIALSSVNKALVSNNLIHNLTTNPTFRDLGNNSNLRIQNNIGYNDAINNITETLTNKTIVVANNTINDTSAVTGDLLVHNGTKFVRVGPGATNIPVINLFTSTIQLRGSNGGTIQFLSTDATLAPNQHFHLFADYVKQPTATEVDFFYGFNSEFRSYKYYSKWSGSNKLYFQINPEFNYSAVWSNMYIGDNARIYFSETGLTSQNTYTFPNSTTQLTGTTDTATLSNKTLANPIINGETIGATTKTSSYTFVDADSIIRADASFAGFTLTLPTAAGRNGKRYGVKKTDTTTNIVIINPNGSETIEGLTAWELRSPGSDVKFISNGTNWNVSDFEELDINAYRRLGTGSNRWYIGGVQGAAGVAPGVSLTTNRLYASPLIISKVSTVNDLAVNVSTGVTSSAVRLGIYKDDGNIYPGALISETSTQPATTSTATFASATFTTPPKLQPGLYWLVINTSGAPNLKTIAVASAMPILGIDNTASTTVYGIGWTVARTYAVLGSPYPAGGTVITTTLPAIYARLK
jgi:hypothetical protein